MDAKEIKSNLKKAREEIRQKEFKNALRYCKEILESDSGNYMALVLIAVAAEGLNQYDQALNAYKRAIQADGSQILAWQGLCSYYEKNYIPAYRKDLIETYFKMITFFKEDMQKKNEVTVKLVRLCDPVTDADIVPQLQGLVEDYLSGQVEYCEDIEALLTFHVATLLKGSSEGFCTTVAALFAKYPASRCLLKSALLIHVDKQIADRHLDATDDMREVTTRYQAVLGETPCEVLFAGQAVLALATGNSVQASQVLTQVPVSSRLVCIPYLLARCSLLLHKYEAVLEACKQGKALLDRKDRVVTQAGSSVRRALDFLHVQALVEMGDSASLNTALHILSKDIGVSEDETRLLKGQIHYKLGDYETAKTCLVGDSVERLSLEGLIELSQDNWDTAAQRFKTAIDRDPDCGSHYLHLARCLWASRDDLTQCFTILLKAAKLDPRNSVTFQYLGQHYMEVGGDVTRARKCFQKSFDLDPHNETSGEKLCDLLTQAGEEDAAYQILLRVTSLYSPGKGKWAWLRLGLHQMKHDDPSIAIASLQAALRADAKDMHVWECLGDAYQCRGSYTASLKAFTKGLDLNPQSIYCLFQIASIKQKLGQHTEAVEEYKQILDLSANYVPALKGLGETYLTLTRKLLAECFHGRARDTAQLALSYLYRGSKLRPDVACMWKMMGDTCTVLYDLSSLHFTFDTPDKGTLNKLETLEYGNRCYVRALKIMPESSGLWHDLGVNYIHQSASSTGDASLSLAEKATQALKKAIQLEPGNYLHWNALGYVVMQEGNYQPALAQHCFIKSIQAEHNNVVAWTNLAALYLKHDNIKLAHEAFKTAQSLEPSYVSCWIGQAVIAELVGHEEAMDLFRHATELNNHVEGGLGYGHWVCSVLLHSDRKDSEAYVYAIEKMGAVAAASDALHKYTDRIRTNPVAYNLHGLLLERQSLYTTAVQQLRRAVQLLETSPDKTDVSREVLSNYARLLRKTGDCGDACSVYTRLGSLATLTQAELCDWGLAAYQQANYRDSYTLYGKALEKASTDLDRSHIMTAMAMVLYKLGDGQAAKTTLFQSSQTSEVSIHSLLALCALGFLHSDGTLVAAATQELSRKPVQNGHHLDVTALQLLGYVMQYGVAGGLRWIQTMVHLDPSRTDLWYILALLLVAYCPQAGQAAGRTARIALEGKSPATVKENAFLVAIGDAQAGACGDVTSCRQAVLSAQRAVHMYPDALSNWACLGSACHLKASTLEDGSTRCALIKTQHQIIDYLLNQDVNEALKKWCLQSLVAGSALGGSHNVMDHLDKLMTVFGTSSDVSEYFTVVSNYLKSRP